MLVDGLNTENDAGIGGLSGDCQPVSLFGKVQAIGSRPEAVGILQALIGTEANVIDRHRMNLN
jgi:hypothetical protein